MSDKERNTGWLEYVTREEFIDLVKRLGEERAVRQWMDKEPNAPVEAVKEAARKVLILSEAGDFQTLDQEVKDNWWQKIEQKTTANNKEAKTLPIQNGMRWGIAASLALLMGLGYLFYQNVTWTKIQMASAEQTAIELPDGSRVQVNASSEISYHSRSFEEERRIRLEGEAFFEVQEGASFTVETSLGEVRVLGTSFNVRQRDGNLQVACQSGKVQVRVAGNRKVLLTRGQAVRYSEANKELDEFLVQDPGQIASWTKGQYMLNDARFEEAIRELERQFDVRVDVPADLNSKTGNFYFTGTDVDSALYQLSWPLNADFQKTGSGTYEIMINK